MKVLVGPAVRPAGAVRAVLGRPRTHDLTMGIRYVTIGSILVMTSDENVEYLGSPDALRDVALQVRVEPAASNPKHFIGVVTLNGALLWRSPRAAVTPHRAAEIATAEFGLRLGVLLDGVATT